jgi:hypothetical protein
MSNFNFADRRCADQISIKFLVRMQINSQSFNQSDQDEYPKTRDWNLHPQINITHGQGDWNEEPIFERA